MATPVWQGLVNEVRYHGPALLGGHDEPHAELLAMVWGPWFDRQQAHSLLTVIPIHRGPLRAAVTQAADCYNALDTAQQHRLRRLIVRHQRRCHNFPRHEFS
jgi:hypothetical protein